MIPEKYWVVQISKKIQLKGIGVCNRVATNNLDFGLILYLDNSHEMMPVHTGDNHVDIFPKMTICSKAMPVKMEHYEELITP